MKRSRKWLFPVAAVTAAALLLSGPATGILHKTISAEEIELSATQVQDESVEENKESDSQEYNAAADEEDSEETDSDEADSSAADSAAMDIDLTDAVKLVISGDELTGSDTSGTLTADQLKDSGISLKNGILKIKASGTYVLSGTLEGNITVSSDSGNVTLVLNGITVESETDNALSVKKTEELVIHLAEGTENIFTSGTISDITEESAIEVQEASGGALYSKAQTTITGSGSLTVNGFINNGIQVTQNLTVESGNITVRAANNGIKVKDTFTLNGGDVNVLSGGDGVEAKRDATEATEEVIDETSGEVIEEAQEAQEAAGTLIINDGSLSIDCYGDAIQANLDLVINGGTINIKTEGEYPEKGEFWGFPGDSEDRENNDQERADSEGGEREDSSGQERQDSEGQERQDSEGQEGTWEQADSQGQEGTQEQADSQGQEGAQEQADSNGEERQESEGREGAQEQANSNGEERQESEGQEGNQERAPDESENGESQGEEAEDSVSEKGLKSDGNITINGGTVVIDSVDDAIHCAATLTINDGHITISTGDDGLHSDEVLIMNGGTVDIQTAYEGVEANQITIVDGDISVIAKDDGFNANGGSESFGGPGDSRQETAESAESAESADPANPADNGQEDTEVKSQEMPNFNILGGRIYVNSVGDGLDSNGSITVTGGFTVVDGPEDSGNGALDSGAENGGQLLISGGTVFAGGSSGMAETFEASSTQYSIKCTLSETYKTGTVIRISTADGELIFEHEVASTGNCIVFSCPEFAEGESYILSVGDNDYTITLSGTSTQVRVNADGTVEEGGSGGDSGGGPGRDSENGEGRANEAAPESDANAVDSNEAPADSNEAPAEGNEAPVDSNEAFVEGSEVPAEENSPAPESEDSAVEG